MVPIILRNQPVDKIVRVCFFNNGWLLVGNNAAQVASFSTTATGLTLTSITDGVVTSTTLDYATYPTIGELAAEISETAGWTATVTTGKASYPSADIVPQQWANAKFANQVIQWEDYQGSFDFSANGIIYGLLPIPLSLGYRTPTSLALSAYRDMKVRICYSAGFPEIPEDLLMVCANLAISAYNGGKEVQTETLGQWSYTYFSPSVLTMADKKVLSRYRERII